MKIIICVSVFFLSTSVGLLYKQRLKNELNILLYLQNFEKFLSNNISLFKVNIVEIIDNYKNMQKEKTAKFSNLFVKNASVYAINEEILNKYILDKNKSKTIFNFLQLLGKSEYEFEIEKNKNFEKYIVAAVEESQKKLNNNGNMYFKLSMALGALLCILIW